MGLCRRGHFLRGFSNIHKRGVKASEIYEYFQAYSQKVAAEYIYIIIF